MQLSDDYVDIITRYRLGSPHYRIILVVARHGSLSCAEIGYYLGMLRQNVHRYVEELIQWRLIVRVGTAVGRYGKYKLSHLSPQLPDEREADLEIERQRGIIQDLLNS